MSQDSRPAPAQPDDETNERLIRLEVSALGERPCNNKQAHAARIARQLRQRLCAGGSLNRLADKGIDVRAFLERQSDHEIVRTHIQCPRCSTLYLPMDVARRLMAASRDAEGWLTRISDASRSQGGHLCTDGEYHFLGYRPRR